MFIYKLFKHLAQLKLIYSSRYFTQILFKKSISFYLFKNLIVIIVMLID